MLVPNYLSQKVCKKTLKSSSVDAGAGQSKKKVSDPWAEMSEKKGGVDTSKADIMVGSFHTSVKGPSALLMSGEKKESKILEAGGGKKSGEDKTSNIVEAGGGKKITKETAQAEFEEEKSILEEE